jgi:hypothetical protein
MHRLVPVDQLTKTGEIGLRFRATAKGPQPQTSQGFIKLQRNPTMLASLGSLVTLQQEGDEWSNHRLGIPRLGA